MNANPFRYRSYYYDNETGFYYLQSRYYDPKICRFINADGLIDVSAGVIGQNLFVYCYNNPVLYTDINGNRPTVHAFQETSEECKQSVKAMKDSVKRNYVRDVTAEVNLALDPYIKKAEYSRYKADNSLPLTSTCIACGMLFEFYDLVNDNSRWDVKIPDLWVSTIGTTFPGEGVIVIYNEQQMTPEDLGNYTYGRLGASYGFELKLLHAGSVFAANFPEDDISIANELNDWKYIDLGYYSYS